jgi:hypothetical protein
MEILKVVFWCLFNVGLLIASIAVIVLRVKQKYNYIKTDMDSVNQMHQ